MGLDQYEVRRWDGSPITLAMLAHAYLAVIRYYARTQGCLEERGAVPAGTGAIPLTVPEVRRLLTRHRAPNRSARAVLVPLDTKTSGQSATKPLHRLSQLTTVVRL